MKEYSLFGIKPDAYTPLKERDVNNLLKKALPENPYDFIDYVKNSLEKYGLEIIKEKEYILSKEYSGKHYEEFKGIWCDIFNESKFDFLLKYMTSGKSYWIIFYGVDAIKKGRNVLLNIRDEYLNDRKKARLNMTHASDSIESANKEINLHFPELNGKVKNIYL